MIVVYTEGWGVVPCEKASARLELLRKLMKGVVPSVTGIVLVTDTCSVGALVDGLDVEGLVVRGLVVRGLVVRGLVVRGLVVRGLVVRGLVVGGSDEGGLVAGG